LWLRAHPGARFGGLALASIRAATISLRQNEA
jgi:hypothetical protein